MVLINSGMRKDIVAILKLSLFWMLLFALQRSVFLLYNSSELAETEKGLMLKSYWYALGMDISTTCYLLFIPVLILLFASLFQNNKVWLKAANIYNIVMIVLSTFVSISDIGLYSVWGSKVNSKAISYLVFPKEALMSVASVPYLLLGGIVVLKILIAVFVYRKWIRFRQAGKTKVLPGIAAIVILVFLMFTGIRGGFQKYPMNKGWVYYSKYPVLNYAALNGLWNFMEIFINPGIKNNPYKYFTKAKADEIVHRMYESESDSTEIVITNQKPNIVLILLESVSAECSGKMGGIPGLMKGFDSLCADGLLFSNFYATGFRTEQGLISYLSCFPAQPKTTIMRQFGKFDKLPNLAKILGDNGYSLNYYYSGNLEFANTGAYLASAGFTKIVEESDHQWQHTTDWGAYDEELFAYQLEEASKDSAPFFSIIMTSTNHEPFKAKVDEIFTGGNEADAYKNSVVYTDKCLTDYLKQAEQKSWYENTLFIITADHAHSYPYARKANEINRHWIPLLWYGEVLKDEYKGKVIDHIGSQTDLASTILAQLGIADSSLERSINMLNRFSPQFAFYTFDNGFGIITPEQALVYDHDMGQVVFKKDSSDEFTDSKILEQGKAYLQQMFEEYIGLNQ